MVAQVGPVPYNSNNITAPGLDGFSISPSDSINFATPCRGIYVGVTGDIVIITPAGTLLTFVGVLAGTILPICAIRVNSTNTTASSLVGVC